ncbi:MAG: DUF1640 domain-containing protein [Gammaproteobacteria bacterium]|nr:DUF1640 domain-containing protein [Gammaproteobacteria bacterium]
MQKTDGQATQEKLIEMLVNVAQHSATREELREVRDELKGDINDLHTEIQSVRTELKGDINELRTEIQSVRTELKGDINELRTELKGENAELRGEIKEFRKEMRSNTYWIIGSLGTIFGILPNLDKIIAYFK